jgi:protein-tyrosine phosphatase
MRILMVCLGNICRSPIAEGVMKTLAQQHHLPWEVDSAATENYHIGEPPHRLSQKVCLQHGIDISQQRARKFTKADLAKYDLIYAMATDVYKEMMTIIGPNQTSNNVHLFLNELHPIKTNQYPTHIMGLKTATIPFTTSLKQLATSL